MNDYQWWFYDSERRGSKHHLFRVGEDLSVCGHVNMRDRAERLHKADATNGPTCRFCRLFERRLKDRA